MVNVGCRFGLCCSNWCCWFGDHPLKFEMLSLIGRIGRHGFSLRQHPWLSKPLCRYQQTYVLKVRTGDRRSAGTKGEVEIKLIGTEGEASMRVNVDDEDVDRLIAFERNETRELELASAEDLGKLRWLWVRCNDSWFLDEILAAPRDRPDSWATFRLHGWLGTIASYAQKR
eukprot:g32106.t1